MVLISRGGREQEEVPLPEWKRRRIGGWEEEVIGFLQKQKKVENSLGALQTSHRDRRAHWKAHIGKATHSENISTD